MSGPMTSRLVVSVRVVVCTSIDQSRRSFLRLTAYLPHDILYITSDKKLTEMRACMHAVRQFSQTDGGNKTTKEAAQRKVSPDHGKQRASREGKLKC
mmetsp:Transcript_41598/g.82093  ORF Transcript_41598/g.82093 Transcript_41598/m.82093 type:complete len:97 (+) Transcript_41598:1024-1314(+)